MARFHEQANFVISQLKSHKFLVILTSQKSSRSIQDNPAGKE
jgi:hypothetical protein